MKCISYNKKGGVIKCLVTNIVGDAELGIVYILKNAQNVVKNLEYYKLKWC